MDTVTNLRKLAATLDPAEGSNRQVGDALYAAASLIEDLRNEIELLKDED